jgi:predicted metal-dependent peptidase
MAPIPGYWNANPAYKGMTADQIYNLIPDSPDGSGNGEGENGEKALCEVMNGDESADGGVSESDRTSMENDWKVATIQAAENAKQQGKLPGAFERFVESITQAKADWRDQLRQFFSQRARDDYSWVRANRRFLPKYVLPGMYSETIGTVVVVTDDSGSVGNDVLTAFEAEIKDIRASSMPERTIHISCDAAINAVQELTREDEFKIISKGGGGTDFRPPFEWLKKRDIEPAVLVYLTDLYGPAPEMDPGYPVIWCCTNERQGPFGTTIHIKV